MNRHAPLALLVSTTLAGLSFGGCAPPAGRPEPAEIETVDVEGSIDEALDTSTDPVGYVPLEEVSGVLPVDYPTHSIPLSANVASQRSCRSSKWRCFSQLSTVM